MPRSSSESINMATLSVWEALENKTSMLNNKETLTRSPSRTWPVDSPAKLHQPPRHWDAPLDICSAPSVYTWGAAKNSRGALSLRTMYVEAGIYIRKCIEIQHVICMVNYLVLWLGCRAPLVEQRWKAEDSEVSSPLLWSNPSYDLHIYMSQHQGPKLWQHNLLCFVLSLNRNSAAQLSLLGPRTQKTPSKY